MSEAIDPVNVIYKLRRTMQEQIEYKYMIGKIHAIDLINQELSNLLEPKEPKKDDPDNITRIRR